MDRMNLGFHSPYQDLVAVLFKVSVNVAVMVTPHQVFSTRASEGLTC